MERGELIRGGRPQQTDGSQGSFLDDELTASQLTTV